MNADSTSLFLVGADVHIRGLLPSLLFGPVGVGVLGLGRALGAELRPSVLVGAAALVRGRRRLCWSLRLGLLGRVGMCLGLAQPGDDVIHGVMFVDQRFSWLARRARQPPHTRKAAGRPRARKLQTDRQATKSALDQLHKDQTTLVKDLAAERGSLKDPTKDAAGTKNASDKPKMGAAGADKGHAGSHPAAKPHK